MRILRMTLIAALLGPMSACLVTARGHATTGPVEEGPPPPPGEHRESGAVMSGVITDAATRQPISQAAVDIVRMKDHVRLQAVSTGAGGEYTTPPVPPGTYIVNVRRNGYRAISADVDLHAGTNDFSTPLNHQ